MRPALESRSAAAPHRRFLRVDPLPPRSPRTIPSLYDGEPETCRRDLPVFLRIWAHLGLILAVVFVWRVEGPAFQFLMVLMTAGLPIHYALPLRWKQPFALALSVLGLGGVLGAGVAAVVVGLGLGLIGAALSPLRWGVRVGLISGGALIAAAARSQLVRLPVPGIVWPVLGALFMFRMILFLYEQKHAERPERPIDAISYFFLLPNVCFPHFPVVDYRTFLRGYFADDVHATQRRGLDMIVRGVTHLLLCNIVDHQWLPPAAEVRDPLSLAWFLAANYLMYLRVSGQFHVACGMLHLLGHKLPETHHHYLLASSFTDYWRRINIYWKDFMVRVVFNPVVFRMKRRSGPVAVAAGTATVFVVTWLLHAYQSFWLRGAWGFSIPDALFWGILGVLVLVNAQADLRASRRRARALADRSIAARLLHGLKIAGTLTTLTLLWALWCSPSVGEFLDLLRRGLGGGRP